MKPDVSVNLWAGHLPGLAFVTVKLSAQSASDIREILKQTCEFAGIDADLHFGALNELTRQLQLLDLPEPTRI